MCGGQAGNRKWICSTHIFCKTEAVENFVFKDGHNLKYQHMAIMIGKVQSPGLQILITLLFMFIAGAKEFWGCLHVEENFLNALVLFKGGIEF